MTWQAGILYCVMKFINSAIEWFNPALHLIIAIGISILTALLAFWTVELKSQTLITFYAFYLILSIMTVLFIYRDYLVNPRTRQLLQFSYFLLGFVLMTTGVLGIINSSFGMASVFLLMLFLPGLAVMRAGLHFKKRRVDEASH